MKSLLIASLLVLSVSGAPANAGEDPVYFHDRMIRLKLHQAAEALREQGDHPSGADLRAQLGRRECELRLPRESVKELDGVGLVRERRPGVLIVGSLYQCGKCDKWHGGGASGVALTRDGVFATCYHVIAKTNAATFVVMTEDGRTAPVVEVLAADERADVAICRAADIQWEPVPLAIQDRPAGSPVFVISHPSGSHFMLTSGLISRYFFRPVSSGRSTPFMAITAEFAKGSSGAPVMDAAGNLAGMVSSTRSIYYEEARGEAPKNLQMVLRQCVPVSAIRALIRTRDAD